MAMTRIALLSPEHNEPTDVVAAIRQRRGGELLDLDRLLLYSPALARGWNAHLRDVRTGLSIDPLLRELAICAVAAINGAHYELEQHGPEFIKAGGIPAFLDALSRGLPHAITSPHVDGPMRAVLDLAIEMSEGVTVSDATFEAARSAVRSDQEMVELVGVIATYNMVSRFLVALELDA